MTILVPRDRPQSIMEKRGLAWCNESPFGRKGNVGCSFLRGILHKSHDHLGWVRWPVGWGVVCDVCVHIHERFMCSCVETKDCQDMSRLRPAACRRKALKWTNSLNDNEKRLAVFGIPQILVTQPSCREPRLSVDVSQSKWHRYPLSLQPPCSD